MTKANQIVLFQDHVRGIIDECAKQQSPRRAAELTAFAILATIDGEGVGCGPYALCPINEKGEIEKDIAGTLHHNLHG